MFKVWIIVSYALYLHRSELVPTRHRLSATGVEYERSLSTVEIPMKWEGAFASEPFNVSSNATIDLTVPPLSGGTGHLNFYL
jgi:hypothetical protein